MKEMFKKIIGTVSLGALLVLPTTALASTTTYNSTYSMTGGVNSKSFGVNAPGTFQVETWGDSGKEYSGLTFTVFLKKSVTGLDEVFSSKDDHYAVGYQSTKFNITKARGSGTYYAYLRNYTGYRFTGEIKITAKD